MCMLLPVSRKDYGLDCITGQSPGLFLACPRAEPPSVPFLELFHVVTALVLQDTAVNT